MAILANGPEEMQEAHRLGEPHYLALANIGYLNIKRVRPELNWKWRTFWQVTNPDGQLCFAKCFFGIGSTKRNEMAGRKESRLIRYFHENLKHQEAVRVPRLDRHWQGGQGEHYVVMEWGDFRQLSLRQWVSTETSLNKLCSFLDMLATLPPPPWWSSEWVFSALDPGIPGDRDELRRGEAPELSAFNYDLVDNLGLDANGRIVFIDYEHLRWESCFLQQVYIAYELLVGSLRYGALPSPWRSPVKRLLANVPRRRLRKNLSLAQTVDRSYKQRQGLWTPRQSVNTETTRVAMNMLSRVGLIGSNIEA